LTLSAVILEITGLGGGAAIIMSVLPIDRQNSDLWHVTHWRLDVSGAARSRGGDRGHCEFDWLVWVPPAEIHGDTQRVEVLRHEWRHYRSQDFDRVADLLSAAHESGRCEALTAARSALRGPDSSCTTRLRLVDG
jgi:hypothetical protein